MRRQAELVQPVEDVQEAMRAVPFWWHSIDLGEGVVTPGYHSLETMDALLAEVHLPDLHGKSVLDVGAWDGFYSFEALRRGARRVVALDHYVWSLDLDAQQRYWRECREQGKVPEPYHEIPALWQPDRLLGKQGFDAANRALGDQVDSVVGDFMDIDLEALGTFDVVLFLGVLYHLEDPFEAIKRLAQIATEVAIISTQAIEVPGFERHAMCEFFESSELGADVSNWWAPNKRALTGMCRAAGFERAEVVSAVAEHTNADDAVRRERIVAHAYASG
jgi:tRNA (mo5U34)-methyltransferase